MCQRLCCFPAALQRFPEMNSRAKSSTMPDKLDTMPEEDTESKTAGQLYLLSTFII
jgi:hypothetical protein